VAAPGTIPRASVCTVRCSHDYFPLVTPRSQLSPHQPHALSTRISVLASCGNAEKKMQLQTKSDASGYGNQTPPNELMYKAAYQIPPNAGPMSRTVVEECMYVRVVINSSNRIAWTKEREGSRCERPCILAPMSGCVDVKTDPNVFES
jgi:hypothetical protein